MQRLSLTPFGRQPVTAGLLATHALADTAEALPEINKWTLFRELCAAREHFGLKDRDLAVLNALLSFHRGDMLAEEQMLVVFPSNRTLMERAHGMAESTLRRHLAKLTEAGLLIRHDSPNGKRYARRGPGGLQYAFGFDLRPLLVRATEITEAADEQRHQDQERRHMRADVVLCLRDIGKLITYLGGSAEQDECYTDLTKRLRRKLTLTQLRTLMSEARTLRDQLEQDAQHTETSNLSGNDSENERHTEEKINIPNLPDQPTLQTVINTCPDILDYAPQGITTWHDLIRLASLLRAVIGIEEHLWQYAMLRISPRSAAVITCHILQSFDSINNPGAYFRYLVEQDKQTKPGGESVLRSARQFGSSTAKVDNCQLANNDPSHAIH